jgi:hypothetical protein
VDTYKHTVYLAASWNPEHDGLNSFVADKLARNYGLLVVGDHKAYGKTPHERQLKYADRVNEILETCSGMVVVFPHKNYSQTTAPFIFLELLLAAKHSLPLLLFCEEGVKVECKKTGQELTLTFGDPNPEHSAPVSADDLAKDPFNISLLKATHSVLIDTKTFVNEPIFLPHSPIDTADLLATVSTLIEEFSNSFREPEKRAYVFNIMPYSRQRERLVVAHAVFQETGIACINGSDPGMGGPFTREEISAKISNAFFIIADLSGLSRACIFETGVAVGSGKDTFVIMKKRRISLPYGVDRLPALPYTNERDLDEIVRIHCRPYRRRVFNIELWHQAGTKQLSAVDQTLKQKVVLLIHGIRTHAEWQEMVREALQSSGKTTVIPIKYGFFDVIRFLLPFGTRRRPIATLRWKISKALSLHRDSELCVVAHSFGTYAITSILSEDDAFRPTRIVFCGSIVPQHFRWDTITNCPEILNECGGRDVWPVLASALSRGYGPSGTYGFGTPGVHDRHHDLEHGDYFSKDFVERYWQPWLASGKIVQSQYEGIRRTTPYWMSLITLTSFRLTFAGCTALILFVLYLTFVGKF